MENYEKKAIKNGLYLVIDPNMHVDELRSALVSALGSKVITAIQIWDHWPNGEHSSTLLKEICDIAQQHDIPVLANNQWELLRDFPLDGVHFDVFPTDISYIKKTLGRPFITGVTLSNDIRLLRQAEVGELDYLSFCSMFPSASVQHCEIVRPDVVQAARKLTKIPLFLAGGILPGNIEKLAALPYDGIAVISGVMHANDPKQAALDIYESFKIQYKSI